MSLLFLGRRRPAPVWAACWTVLFLAGCGGPSTAPSSASKADAERVLVPKVKSVFEPGQGKANFVTALALSGKTLWIGTRSGLYSANFSAEGARLDPLRDPEAEARFSGQEVTSLGTDGPRVLAGTTFGHAVRDPNSGWSGEETGRANALAGHQGMLYLGRSTGIERLGESKSWTKLIPEPPLARNQTSAQHINSLAVGKEGDVWAGTNFGLLHVSPATGKWEHFYTAYQDIKSEKVVSDESGNADIAGNFVNSVRIDPATGKLLVATDIGVSIFDGKWVTYTGDHTKYIVKDDALVRVPVKGTLALPSSEVRAAAIEDSILWIGTRAGLVRYAGSQLEVFDSERGLPDDSIRALVYDPASRTVFAGTEAGVAVVAYE